MGASNGHYRRTNEGPYTRKNPAVPQEHHSQGMSQSAVSGLGRAVSSSVFQTQRVVLDDSSIAVGVLVDPNAEASKGLHDILHLLRLTAPGEHQLEPSALLLCQKAQPVASLNSLVVLPFQCPVTHTGFYTK